jgi:hypothetical protein
MALDAKFRTNAAQGGPANRYPQLTQLRAKLDAMTDAEIFAL